MAVMMDQPQPNGSSSSNNPPRLPSRASQTSHSTGSLGKEAGTNDDSASASSLSATLSQEDSPRPSRVITRTVSEVRDGIANQREAIEVIEDPGSVLPDILEKRPSSRRSRSQRRNPNLVTWDGPDDPNNPKEWSFNRKWAAVSVVSMFTFISPVSSTALAPATAAIGRELGITNEFEQALTLSIFVLAYGVGPLFVGPMSEVYGRVPVIQLSNLFYLFFNLGCGLARTKSQMIVFRFLAGLGGSAPIAIGGGVLGDLFRAEDRGRAMSVYSLAPLLGPVIGPIAGGFITERTSWRWIFYSTTIADAVIQIAGLFLLQETYAPVLLQRKRARLIKETGNPALHTEFDQPDRTLAQILATALTRPFRMLFSQVIVQVLALYIMYLYGVLYLAISTFPALWEGVYGESVQIAGLNYISLGVGLFIGAQVCAPLQDRIYSALKKRSGQPVGRPEFRVPIMVPGSILVPAGLVIYGWCAQYRTHWIGPNIGVGVFAMGNIMCFQCIQGYLVDTYTRYAASAVGACTVLRSFAGFGFPLFAPAMYKKLNYGWGNTTIALIAVILGWPAPILLWTFGERLRKKSPFATGQ